MKFLAHFFSWVFLPLLMPSYGILISLFVPAYSKRPPFRRYIGQAAIAGPILEFVQKNAEVKFKYPVDVSRVGFKKEE